MLVCISSGYLSVVLRKPGGQVWDWAANAWVPLQDPPLAAHLQPMIRTTKTGSFSG
jgi:hypothetical protein